ncbi:MAG: right-handed parallel beta-helix repeat-containing protein [Thermoplasmata archaeon]|nr:right-handed parallel beta-helix repeat-containing protein [Thermoplasmata archaeon]
MKWLRVILASLLILSLVSVPMPVQAVEVTGVNLIVNDFLNNSTAKALSWLNFDSENKPNPGSVDNLIFEWYAPNGSLAFTDIIDPDVEAVAWSYYHVEALGDWFVNVSYAANASIVNNKSFSAVPDHWGPGNHVVSRTTLVSTDATLTIEPGTTVAFDQNKSLAVEGKIIAQGDGANPIVFTSNLLPKTSGDWASLKLYSSIDKTSVLDHITVAYSREGLVLNGASVNVTNSHFVNNLEKAIHAISSNSTIRDNYIEKDVSGISPYGILSVGSTLTIEGNEIHFMSVGIYLLNTNDTTKGNLVMDSKTIGMYIVNSIVNSTGDTLLGNWKGVQLDDHANVVFEDLTVTGFKEGFLAYDHSKATLWNSTVDQVEVLTFELSRGCTVHLVNTSFATFQMNPGVSISPADDSVLYIQNFLTVEVISHDNGTHLANASVDVYDGSNRVYNVTTDASGFSQLMVVTDMTYLPTLINNITRIHVSWYDLAFQQNNRSVFMDKSHTEVFNGSVNDLDGDGEPDFSDGDIDGDGLDNTVEGVVGTDPTNPDSDSDGIPDGYEFDYQILDPLFAGDSSLDPDGDGLTNLEEYLNGTFPDFADSDSDGVDDLKEIDCGMDPVNATDADDDWDDDGYDNGQECRAGTDLLDPEDRPEPGIDLILIIAAIVVIVVVLVVVLILTRRKKAALVTEEEPSDEDEDEDPAEEEPEDMVQE